MKKWLFCFTLFCLINSFNSKKAISVDAISIATQIISMALGDGTVEACVYKGIWADGKQKTKGILKGNDRCDEWEDTSLVDEVGGVFSSNKKSRICSANAMVKNISRVAGYIAGGPLGYLVGNLVGNSLQCFEIVIEAKKSAIDNAKEYHVCFDTQADGHPLPYTNRQIIKILKQNNDELSIKNIVDKYDKLCLCDKNEKCKFYKDGDITGNIYIHHADGYAYVICASNFTACPCIFNVGRGVLTEPQYKKDENGVIEMDENGNLLFIDDEERERYTKRYAKHCRIIRFQDLYEQQNDIAPIFDESCFTMKGYSKRAAPVTAGIVQCFEGTARNIFEKPIYTVEQTTVSDEAVDVVVYDNDYRKVNTAYTRLQNIIQGRDLTKILENDPNTPPFLDSQKQEALDIIKELWFTENSTTDIRYECIEGGKAKYDGHLTTLQNKYIDNATGFSTKNCCSNKNKIQSTCYTDDAKNYFDSGKRHITANTNAISNISYIYDEFDEISKLRTHINGLKQASAKAQSIDMEGKQNSFSLTLFDLFRNRIKAIAAFVLVFWFFIQGWKAINGEFQKLDLKSMSMLFLKVFLCYMIVFSDSAKNYVFNLAIQTSQGVGMFFSSVFGEVRSSQDNRFNAVCNYTSKNTYSPEYKRIENMEEKYVTKNSSGTFTCPSGGYEQECVKWDPNDSSDCIQVKCVPYSMTCGSGLKLSCSRYAIDNNGYLNKNICLAGVCLQDKTDYVARPFFERPYKVHQYYSVESGVWKGIRPRCHINLNGNDFNETKYESTDPKAVKVYSRELNDYIWACSEKDADNGYVLDDGYRINALIELGLIDNPATNPDAVLVFKSLLSDAYLEKNPPNNEIIDKLKNTVVRTAVATTNPYGVIEEYDFIDSNNATEGFNRAKYRIYLDSKMNYLNRHADYPKIKKYNVARNYKHLAFWDSMDCKIIQFLTFQGGDSGMKDDDIASAVQNVNQGDITGLASNAINVLFKAFKFVFITFPFGMIIFALSLAIGVILFMLVARACQQYCICVFNLILTIYLSPFIFVLWLFKATESALKSWTKDLQSNILGACVPFVSISMFLFVIDWIFFGDVSKYVSEKMFTSSGTINKSCYEGHESDAPFACLAVRLIDEFNLWNNILSLITMNWNGIFSGTTWKMAFYLVLRALFGLAILVIFTTIMDDMEKKIYNAFGGQPDTKLGFGFEQTVGESMKTGVSAFSSAIKVFGKMSKIMFAPILAVGKVIGGLIYAGISALLNKIFPPQTGDSKKIGGGKKIGDSLEKIGGKVAREIGEKYGGAIGGAIGEMVGKKAGNVVGKKVGAGGKKNEKKGILDYLKGIKEIFAPDKGDKRGVADRIKDAFSTKNNGGNDGKVAREIGEKYGGAIGGAIGEMVGKKAGNVVGKKVGAGGKKNEKKGILDYLKGIKEIFAPDKGDKRGVADRIKDAFSTDKNNGGNDEKVARGGINQGGNQPGVETENKSGGDSGKEKTKTKTKVIVKIIEKIKKVFVSNKDEGNANGDGDNGEVSREGVNNNSNE